MKLREFAGHVNRAEAVYVWVEYAEAAGTYLKVEKVVAREIVKDAKATDGEITEISAHLDKGELFVGGVQLTEGAAKGKDEEE